MNFSNPTRIQIGSKGTFDGVMYRVVGRVVLGVEQAGQTYYWNEFNLETGGGHSADLVFESGGLGPQWRLFKLIEPSVLSATEAAAMRVSSRFNLDGMEFYVARLDSSRIYHIEGKGAEGERVGSEANYFNAQAGNQWAVVSWTGDEVECYRGRTISARDVATAFHLQGVEAFHFVLGKGRSSLWPIIARVAIPILVVTLIVSLFASVGRSARPSAVTKIPAPASTLRVGSVGAFKGANYRIVRHALLDVAEVGILTQQREYSLQDGNSNAALLVQGSNTRMAWYNEIHPSVPLTPQMAGGFRVGQTANIGDVIATVHRLCRYTVRQADGAIESKPGDVFYGFAAGTDTNSILVRWNQNEIKFYQGAPLLTEVHWESAK